MAREWDATTYDRVGTPMERRGRRLLDRIELRGDEVVLDAGCGTGRVTAALLERLPRGRVVALDGSAAMLDRARVVLGDDPRVTFVHADLTRPLPLAERVDAIVTTSTLHWVPDHPALFRRFAAALRPGGVLLADFGGHGNIASVLAALAELGETWSPWTFATPDEARAALDAAGFTRIEVDHVADPAPVPPEDLEHYLRTVVLGSHLERRDPAEGAALVRGVAARLPAPVMDYVRLQVVARLSGSA